MSNTELRGRGGEINTTKMDLAELQEKQKRLQEYIDARRENEKVYLKEALKLHQKLNEFIQVNGITTKTEEKMNNTLEIIEIYDSFVKKLTQYIDRLKKDIEEITN